MPIRQTKLSNINAKFKQVICYRWYVISNGWGDILSYIIKMESYIIDDTNNSPKRVVYVADVFLVYLWQIQFSNINDTFIV